MDIIGIANGDFVLGDTYFNEVEAILMSHPGSWIENPTMGVGLQDYVKSTGQGAKLYRSVRENLAMDGKGDALVQVVDANQGQVRIQRPI
jgi:hypothetical protein